MRSCIRMIVSAPKSGSGKTLFTCGLLRALMKRSITVCSMKCGPDYIDPMYHRYLGVQSGNLDSYFSDDKTINRLLNSKILKAAADVCVIEGAMGLYDGLGGVSSQASCNEISGITGAGVVLLVDAKGASVSLAALIKGMLEYEPNDIRAVILNRCSKAYYGRLKSLIEEKCRVEVCGYIPENKELLMPSRHLGLVSPGELECFSSWADCAAAMVEQGVDIDRLLYLFSESNKAFEDATETDLSSADDTKGLHNSENVIAVAKDEAFSFYYEENLRVLERNGARLEFFSPLHDSVLPKNTAGIILGGGYPELYAMELSANSAMLQAIRDAISKGMPFLAECGGFLYLQKSLEDAKGQSYPMAGIFDGYGFSQKKLQRFGYAEYSFKEQGCFGEAGISIRGHEFHHWECSDNGDGAQANKPYGEAYQCMNYSMQYAAGFPHLYYESNEKAIINWLRICSTWKRLT